MPGSRRSSGPSEPARRAPGALLLSGARLADGRLVDVRLSGGRIEAVGTAGSLATPGPPSPLRSSAYFPPYPRDTSGGEIGERHGGQPDGQSGRTKNTDVHGPVTESREAHLDDKDSRGYVTDNVSFPNSPSPARLDLSGYLLLPAPAEPHAHLDTALTAADHGPPSDSPEDVQRRVIEAALQQLSHGATAVRTHVRVGDVQGLRALEAVLQARRALRDLVDVFTVAEPRVLTGAAGADGLAILRDALKMGADVVGGCPDLDPDPAGYVEAVLHMAAEFGCAVDLHSDAAEPARLARLAAMAGGLRPGVAIGPCGGLTQLPAEVLSRVAAQLAAAGVTVVCLPQGGCATLEGRSPGNIAPVRALRAAGVPVAAGSGALRDAANPVGRADPLGSAYLISSLGRVDATAAYESVSTRSRAVLGLPEVRVEAGFPAELLAVRGEGIAEALSLGYSRVVVHRGRVVSRISAVREYTDTASLGLPRQTARPVDP